MSGLTNYTVGGVDLSGIFQKKISGSNAATGYTVGGIDLSTIFQPLGSNDQTSPTYYTVNNYAGVTGQNWDLNKIFAPISQYNGIWPYINLNNKNTRQSIYNGPTTNPTSAPITYSYYQSSSSSSVFHKTKLVIGATGIIYIANSTTGDIYALTIISNTLTFLYKYTTSYIVAFTPTIGLNNTMYYSSTNTITALQNIDTSANFLWSYTSSSPAITSPNSPIIGANQTIYVSTGNGYIFAINNNGTLKWSFLVLSNSYLSNLAIGSDGTIYVAASTNLYAVTDNGNSASFKWTNPFNTGYTLNSSSILNTPSIDSNGHIYIIASSTTSYVFAIIDNGTNTIPSQKWVTTMTNYKLGTYYINSSIGYVNLSIANNGSLYVFNSTTIISINSSSGAIFWTTTTTNIGSTITAVSIGNDSSIYTTGDYGFVSRITDNGSSYTFNWYAQLTGAGGAGGGYSSACSIGSNGKLYYGCDHNLIFAINQ